jgi:hypothetical protein
VALSSSELVIGVVIDRMVIILPDPAVFAKQLLPWWKRQRIWNQIMEPPNRDRYRKWAPFWFAVLALGLIVLFIIGITARAAPVTAAVLSAGGAVTASDSPTHARLSSAHHLLIDQPGAHLGPPQTSPDDQMVAVVVVPTGNETAYHARIHLFDVATGHRLGDWAGHTPQWASRELLTWRSGDERFVFDARSGQTTRRLSTTRSDPFAEDAAYQNSESKIHNLKSRIQNPTFPVTIRVLHHPSNGCRNVPAGQIDIIPFEEYVARVIPAEMPAFWRFDALAAQAVAARTYAWRQILAGRPDYDVTDWANYQVMCDARYPTSDAATAATAGQYLSERGDEQVAPIWAMYSAENGHPTLTNANVHYLEAVPDLFSLGKERFGHGFGLSQWGAQRRALAGHNYRQILGHYYTMVHLQNALAPDQPLGGLVAPAPGDWLTTGALFWRALLPDSTQSVTFQITSSAGLTATMLPSAAEGLWRAPARLPDQTTLTIDLRIANEWVDRVSLVVDASPPATPHLELPVLTFTSALTVVVAAETGNRIGLHNDWVWQGEQLSHTVNSGQVVRDDAASNGLAWQAERLTHRPGVWYGPYTTVLPAGDSYRAIFWLRIADLPAPTATAAEPPVRVAQLDVSDRSGEEQLGLRDLWPSDFADDQTYHPVAVDFHLFAPADGLEFRINWFGAFDLTYDRVEVWTLPDLRWQDDTVIWSLPDGAGEHSLAAAAFDEAGNISPATVVTTLLDLAAPTVMLSVTGVTTDTVRLAWQASDDAAGVEQVEIEQRMIDNDWAAHPESPFAAEGVLVFSLAEDQVLDIRLRADDRAGRRSEWTEWRFFTAVQPVYLPFVTIE